MVALYCSFYPPFEARIGNVAVHTLICKGELMLHTLTSKLVGTS
jgi:hypothetical protein